MINGTGGFSFSPDVHRDHNLTAFITELYRYIMEMGGREFWLEKQCVCLSLFLVFFLPSLSHSDTLPLSCASPTSSSSFSFPLPPPSLTFPSLPSLPPSPFLLPSLFLPSSISLPLPLSLSTYNADQGTSHTKRIPYYMVSLCIVLIFLGMN